ncbi:hsp90 co-chaperone Cdc37 [Coemansia asiatica]|uniref:Hsp90 chaperone protein kinase-targeting subunit n=1 Tax=Coemansia asiatica TaxID=1052880 RepID=A0A9W7XIE7_9FUNG|nr:hsp90 co-chaperone Cdc37 [Coemansia asiatica]
MPIDYSKWDNLELSDDSDVEIHPNIEKGTFLRLRQRKIREEREKRRQQREANEEIVALNTSLSESIGKLRNEVTEASSSTLSELIDKWQKDAQRGAEYMAERNRAVERGEESPVPSQEDMMDTLKARIKSELSEAAVNAESMDDMRMAIAGLLDGHLEKLEKNKADAEKELERIRKEEAKHVAPDSVIHEGFNRSIVGTSSSGSSSKAAPSATTTVKQTVTTDEVLNPDSVGKHKDVVDEPKRVNQQQQQQQEGLDENGELEFDEDARQFASLTSLSVSYDFIRKHFSVISERKSDQIMAQAFTAELAGKKKLARQYVHQALIITYVLKMGSTGINVFFNRVGSKGQAQDMFIKDVESYYERIENRCKVIKSESEQEAENEVESIQLQCDDPNAPIRISVPADDEQDKERLALFEQLPEELRAALREGTLDAINKVLATISGSEAERLLGICGQGNFLVIDGEIVVDPNEEKNKNKEESDN